MNQESSFDWPCEKSYYRETEAGRKEVLLRCILGDDKEGFDLVTLKSRDEQLTYRQTGRVACAYAIAKTDEERNAVLQVSGRHRAYEQAVQLWMLEDPWEQTQPWMGP